MFVLKVEFLDGSNDRFDLSKFDFRFKCDGAFLEVYSKENGYPTYFFPTSFIKKITVKNRRGVRKNG